MLHGPEGSSEGPVWYRQQDGLLWNQLNALHYQLVQSNHQLSLQQNLILGLQEQLFHRCLQSDADQNLIWKLVGKLLEPECSDVGREQVEHRLEHAQKQIQKLEKKLQWEATKRDDNCFLSQTAISVLEEQVQDLQSAIEILEEEHRACSCTAGDQCCKAEPPLAGQCDGEEPVATEGAPPTAAAPRQLQLWNGDPCREIPCDTIANPDEKPPKKRRSLGESTKAPDDGDSCDESPTSEELAGTEVGGGEYTPSDLHLPNLLPYLSVQELLSWRLLSRRTRSPEVLIQHVAEMGSMDRPEAITAFAEKVKMFCDNPAASFAAALQGDAQLYDSAFQNSAKQQKLYECQSWCMALASNERAHFAEVHIRRIVGKNLESLLWHHRSADASVAKAASLLVFNYASDALPFVQQRIAEVMLDLIEDFVESNIPANLVESQKCIRTLEKVLRSLSKPQRQRAVSLMVKLVMDPHVPKQAVIWQLKMLWLADDNPRQTYAQAHQQLQIVAKSDTAALKNDLLILLNSC